MKQLWAPWRMEFIKELRKREGGCIFCELHSEGDDRERLVLYRGRSCYAVMNRFPYNNGHLMIVPYRHEGSLSKLDSTECAEMMELNARSIEILSASLEAEGFNCGFNIGRVAGAGITDHIHLHVVPRWNGDTNFMPVLGDTSSMPEYLSDTYDRIIGGFEKIKGQK